MNRLEACARVTQLIRNNINKNKGYYSGMMVPNLQTIIDIATLPDEYMPNDLENKIARLESEDRQSDKPKFADIPN